MMVDETLQITILLHKPSPSADSEDGLIVPYTNTETNTTRLLSHIGKDYLCLDIIGGFARFTECIPFSNISGIRWLE